MDNSNIKIQYQVGITGNYYFTSISWISLEEVCYSISKSSKSIYYSSKYDIYFIRIKDKKTKELIRSLYTRGRYFIKGN